MSDNIKVVVKVRPLIPREIEEKQSYRWRVRNNTLNQLDQSGRETEVCFTFDKVYDKDTKTQEVYNDIAKPIVEAAIAGFNGTIFAYGQTSSGKTYTMSGTEESPGIIPLSVLNLFEKIKTVPDRDFLVRVSFIEIYNEKVKDLLNVEKENIKIHESLQGVKVDCLEKVTSSPEEVLEAMKEGEANRQTGATNMNEESSRSHSIFQITIESREHIEGEDQESGCVNVSQLNLVDLAGSERAGQTGATGLRFKEGTHINKSLSVLALVIKQLSEGPNKYANYRDSKLTRILQNSLGGNAKTSIICAITPASVEETISTLQFANRAKAIKNKPEVNAVTTNATMIQGLTKQLSKLQAELAAKRNLEVMLESKKTVEQELQKQIATLQKLILNGFGQHTGLDLGGAGRRKPFAPRRMTIHTTSHHTEDEPPPAVPKFSTPILKFNPMCLPSAEYAPVQSSSKLATVPEETRMITPPPEPRKNVGFSDEIIEIDSDDEASGTRCSPYHKCYSASVTPPCVLRRNAKEAEKNLKEIVELTEREKIYTPNVVELIEKLESNTNVITRLEDDISTWVQKCKEKDLKIDELTTKVTKTEDEVKTIKSAKEHLEVTCKEKDILLTDLEVSYETLKKQFKNREQELLNFLAEHQQQNSSNQIYTSKSLKPKDKDIANFMDLSRDISLVNSDSSIVATEECASIQMQDLVNNLQSELNAKCKIIDDLENQISTQKQNIDDLESSSQKLQESVNEFINELSIIETKNVFLQGTIETLNATIEKQKENLESANKDIQSYNSTIQELQIKLINRDEFVNSKVDNNMLESLIETEQNIIANNDNLRNIIYMFRTALDQRNKELNSLKKGMATENKSLKEQIEIKENQITALIAEAEKLNNQLNENASVINKLLKVENELSSQVSLLEDQNKTLQSQNSENAKLIEEYNIHKSESEKDIGNLRMRNMELTRTVEEKDAYEICLANKNTDLETRICDMAEILHNIEKDLLKAQSGSEKLTLTLAEKETDVQTLTKKIDELTEENHLLEKKLAEKQIAYDELTLKLSERGDNEEKMQADILELSQLRECLNIRINYLEREMSDKDLFISAESERVNKENEGYVAQIAAAVSKLDALLTKFKFESQDCPNDVSHLSQAFITLNSKINSLDTLVTTTLANSLELEEKLMLLEQKHVSQESNFQLQVESLKQELQQASIQLSQQVELSTKELEILNKEVNGTEGKCACKDTKTLSERINQLFYRLHNILKKLNGDSEKAPEVNGDLECTLDNFEFKINSLDKSVTIILEVGEDLQLQLKTLAEAHGVQLEIFYSQIDKLSHRITQQSEDLKHLTKLCEDLEKTRADLHAKNQECIELESKLENAEENNKKLNDELRFKENELASLQENEQNLITLRVDLENIRADLYSKNQECLDLEAKLHAAEENNKKLDEDISSKEKEIASLQENEQRLITLREDLEKTQTDSYSKNQECLDLEAKLHAAEENNKKLDEDISSKEKEIASFQENEQNLITLHDDLEKTQADLHDKNQECLELETKLHAAEENNRKLGEEISLKEKEIATIQENEQNLITLREDFEKTLADLHFNNQKCLEVETKLQTAKENNRKLSDEICSNEKEIASLRENEQHLVIAREDLEKTCSDLHFKNQECLDLDTKLHAAEENYKKLSDELSLKEKEIASLLENAISLRPHRESDKSKSPKANSSLTKEENVSELTVSNELDDLLKIISKVCYECGIEYSDNIASSKDNIYQKLSVVVDKVYMHIHVCKTESDVEKSSMKKMLKEAEIELDNLTEKHLTLTQRNQHLLQEIDEVNNELLSTRELLRDLTVELQGKRNEIKIMEEKAIMWKEQFVRYEETVNKEIRGLVSSNKKLKSLLASQNIQSVTLNKSDSSVENYKIYEPQSLVSICCKNIIDFIQPNVSKKNSSTTISSECSISLKSCQSQTDHIPCDCNRLSLELNKAQEENLQLVNELSLISQQSMHLTDMLKELQASNQYLLEEREAVRKEVQMLVEPAIELQKKIANHKTYLSTLTATTHAENTLLNSKLRVLNHNHKRYVHVCQRDLPAFKSQLKELMTLLKACSCYERQNNSYKRYSLPDVLDNNTTVSTLKHESTLDGDLLMLDTNVTLTTMNNTLAGPDQTCLEMTQNFDTESSCQANDISKDIDPYLAYSQLETLTTDNQKLVEKIDSLMDENFKLKEHISCFINVQNKFKDAQTSPFKINTKNESISANMCEFCNEYSKELHILKEKNNLLSMDLKEMQEEKDKIELKYTNLSLEIPSTEALVKKLNSAEKESNCRLSEINKLNSELNKKNKMVKELQEENDTLSVQVMENISEGDELKKELDSLKDEHYRLIEICKKKESDYIAENCPQCQMKDDLIKMLQQQPDQPKLNRSFSDSESSSRHNKICTLQNELHASKEDCKKITEEVATIKNQLERSNISMSQAMDLDESMGEAGIFTITKDLNGAQKSLQPNDCNVDNYVKEKRDCFKFYMEKIGSGKENVETDIKIIDIMKMLYNNLIARHGNEVENLMNKLRDFEDTKKELHLQLAEANSKNMEVTKELKDSSTLQNILKQIQENINILNKEMDNIVDPDKNTLIVTYFKENLLRVLDSGFGLTFVNIFEKIINNVFDNHDKDLSLITEQNTKLQNHMETVVKEFNTANENFKQIKDQLSAKESEYNTLKTQKEMILEISNAVTLDIVNKEKELNETLDRGCKKLLEVGLIESEFDSDAALSLNDKFQLLFERVLKAKQNDTAICKTREELTAELEMLKSSLQEKEMAVNLIQEKKESALEQIEKEKQTMLLDINTIRTVLEEKENYVKILQKQVAEVEQKLEEQQLAHEDRVIVYESKLQDNATRIQKLMEEIDTLKTELNGKEELSKEIEILKEDILQKESVIKRLESEAQKIKDQLPVSEECTDILAKVEILREDYDNLMSLNKVLIEEKENYALELEKAKEIIVKNKAELEKMTSDILVLRESVNENVSIIQSLTTEAKSMAEQNIELKKQFEQKNEDCIRLEMNIKTHEKTAQIQSKMIIRLQKQKEEDDKALADKEKRLDDLAEKYAVLEKECDEMKLNLEAARKDVEMLRNTKESLEGKLAELETEWQEGPRRRPSMEAGAVADSVRRRRQSLYDSKRFDDIEAVFDTRAPPDDLFGNDNTPSPTASAMGSPTRRSTRDTSHGDEDSGRSSVTQTRRRRQSLHDQRRGALTSAFDSPSADVVELRARLETTQQELAELQERYRELDEECDTCAQYLRERDEQCRKLRKDKTALEMRIADLTLKLASGGGVEGERPSVAHAAVNTDEDWANLHSVVVDRMSFDAEVEKNKKLSRTIDELRCNKQELKATIAKMQRALEKSGSQTAARELESVRVELASNRQQLAELQERYRELDEECDTCAQYLRERDEQCRKLRQAKNALEAKLQELTGELSACTSTRRKRQSLHDSNRSPAPAGEPPHDAQTQVSEDLLMDHEDNAGALKENQAHAEIKRLKMNLDTCLREKAVLENQLMAAVPALNPTLYVATGSAIVQNQQITDVMRENHRLKKLNAKLVNFCKKRGKKLDPNQENEDPSDLG